MCCICLVLFLLTSSVSPFVAQFFTLSIAVKCTVCYSFIHLVYFGSFCLYQGFNTSTHTDAKQEKKAKKNEKKTKKRVKPIYMKSRSSTERRGKRKYNVFICVYTNCAAYVMPSTIEKEKKELGSFISIFLKWLEFTQPVNVRMAVWHIRNSIMYDSWRVLQCAWATEVTSFGHRPTRKRKEKEKNSGSSNGKNCVRSTFAHVAVYIAEEIGSGDAQSKPCILYMYTVLCTIYDVYCRPCISCILSLLSENDHYKYKIKNIYRKKSETRSRYCRTSIAMGRPFFHAKLTAVDTNMNDAMQYALQRNSKLNKNIDTFFSDTVYLYCFN